MNRRGFVRAAGAGLWNVRAASAAPPVIDTHIHLYDPARPEGVPWPPRTDAVLYRRVLPADYEALVRPLGITGAIVIEASPWLEDNQWLLEITRDRPLFRGVIGHLQPGTPEFRIHLARFTSDRRFRGIRLGADALVKGAPQPAFLDDLRRLAAAGLTLDALGNASMLAPLTAIAEKIPSLRIVIDHMPLEPPGWTPAAIRDLAAHPTVYAKISGVVRADLTRAPLDEVRSLFAPERLLYGSNWPVSERVAPYPAILAAVPEPARFTPNAIACYGLL